MILKCPYLRQSRQSSLSITVSIMMSSRPFTQQIYPSTLSSLNSSFFVHFCRAHLPFCQCLRFLRPVLIGSTFFFLGLLFCSIAQPCRVETCPVWPSGATIKQVLLPQPPSHTEIPASSLFHHLSLSLCSTDCSCAKSK